MVELRKRELLARWLSPAGQQLLKAVLGSLGRGRSLDAVEGLGRHGGRLDLRGAVLSVVESERTIGTAEHSLAQKFGSLRVKRAKLAHVDFSYADISYGYFRECAFEDCLFTGTRAKEINVYASDFNACEFTRANFAYSFMNMNVGGNAGSYTNCRFVGTNLKECIFSFPVMDNCLFEGCKLNPTNFDGSRMRNVKFKGKMDSPWFRGHSTSAQKSLFWIFNRIDPGDYPNRMENVDFTEAELFYVSFSDGIDLSRCRFPDSDRYILIKDMKGVMKRTRSIVESEWTGEYKYKALDLIDDLYYTKSKFDQEMDLIDTFPIPGSDVKFLEAFFGLIKEINEDQEKNRKG